MFWRVSTAILAGALVAAPLGCAAEQRTTASPIHYTENAKRAYDQALVALRALIADYPDSKHTVEMAYMLEVVTGLLARHELYVARFYLGRDNFDAAVARCEYSLTNYQDSGLEAEALVLLGETYLKMK